MLRTKALPHVKDLGRNVGTAVPYDSMALKTVPLLAPEYGETAIKIDASFGSNTLGLKAVPYVANTASRIST